MKAPWLLGLAGILAVAPPGWAQDDPLYRGKHLSQYVRALQGADKGARVKAAAVLGEMHLPEPTALAALTAALADRSPEVRRQAAAALVAIGPEAVPYLAKALDHADPAVRASAVSSLGQFSPRSRAAVPALIRALRDSDSRVCLTAATELGRFGPAARAAVPDLIAALQSPIPELRPEAVKALGSIGAPARAAVGPLVAVLKEQRRAGATPRVLEVVEALGRIGPAAGAAVPALVETLQEEDPGLRLRTAWALLAIGADAQIVVPVLIAMLGNSELERQKDGPPLQAQAADLLGWIGPEARAAVPVLVRQVIHREYPVGAAALKALDRIGDPALPELIRLFGQTPDPKRRRLAFLLKRLGAKAVRPLMPILDHPQAEVRAAAVEVLGELGREAEAAIPRLEAALHDPAMTVRLSAADALLGIDRHRHLPALRFLARTLKDKKYRVDSLRILTYLTPKVESAAPAFAELALDADDEVSERAWRALTRLGPSNKLAVQIARRALGSPKAARRRKALEALDPLGPEALDNLDLILSLADGDAQVRHTAAVILGRRGPSARAAVSALRTALKDMENEVRLQAIESLGRIGPAAAPALPDLMAAWDIPDASDKVAEALRAIGPPALPFLLQAFLDGDAPRRRKVASVLAEVAVKAQSSALAVALEDRDPAVRRTILEALGKAPPEFLRCFRSTLVEMALKEPDAALRRCALDLLESIGREAAPTIRVALQDPVADIRTQAARILIQSPHDVSQAISVLLQGIKNHSAREIGDAERALCYLGPEAKPAVPILQTALQDTADDVRLWAAIALGRIGPAARAAVPALRRALRDGDPQVRLAAADTLTTIEHRPTEALAVLIEAVRRGDQADKSRIIGPTLQASSILYRYGSAAVPRLIPAILGEEPDLGAINKDTLSILGYFGTEARSAVPGLIAALRTNDLTMPPLRNAGSTTLAGEVIRTLGNMGPEAREAVPLLVEILRGKDQRLHAAAAEALGKIGPAAAAAVPALQAALREQESITDSDLQRLSFELPESRRQSCFYTIFFLPDKTWEFAYYPSFEWYFGHDIRSQAAYALGQMGPAARGAIPALREAQQTRSWPSFRLAEAIWKLSGRADWVTPDLVRLLRESPRQGAEVFILLARMGPEAKEAVPILTQGVHEYLSRPSASSELMPLVPAIQALGWIGPAAREAIPDLERALRSDEDEVRGAAAMALWRIDRRTKQAITVLVQLVDGVKPYNPAASATTKVDPWVRVAAAEALAEMGSAARPALPSLLRALRGKNGELRVAAAVARWRITGDSAPALPVLLGILRGKDETARPKAAESLGRLGPRARAAIPALQEALTDNDGSLRRAAVAALQQIR